MELSRGPRGVLMFAADDGARHRHRLSRQENDVEQGRRRGVRPAMVLAAAVGVALLAVACGSGGSPPAAAGVRPTASRVRSRSACARTASRASRTPPARASWDLHANLHAAPFVRAWNACEHLLPDSGQVTAAQQRQAVSQALKLVACLRAHGLGHARPHRECPGHGAQPAARGPSLAAVPGRAESLREVPARRWIVTGVHAGLTRGPRSGLRPPLQQGQALSATPLQLAEAQASASRRWTLQASRPLDDQARGLVGGAGGHNNALTVLTDLGFQHLILVRCDLSLWLRRPHNGR